MSVAHATWHCGWGPHVSPAASSDRATRHPWAPLPLGPGCPMLTVRQRPTSPLAVWHPALGPPPLSSPRPPRRLKRALPVTAHRLFLPPPFSFSSKARAPHSFPLLPHVRARRQRTIRVTGFSSRRRRSSPSAMSSSHICFSFDWWLFPHYPLSTGTVGSHRAAPDHQTPSPAAKRRRALPPTPPHQRPTISMSFHHRDLAQRTPRASPVLSPPPCRAARCRWLRHRTCSPLCRPVRADQAKMAVGPGQLCGYFPCFHFLLKFPEIR
jgi:hypothetical protein